MLREEEVRELVQMAEESKSDVSRDMQDRGPERFNLKRVGKELRDLAGSLEGGKVGECPRCTPDPCVCDRSPSGPGTQSMLPEHMRSQRPLTESRTWKEYVAMGKGGGHVGPRRKEKEETMNETELELQEPEPRRKRRAGGLPSDPEPIKAELPDPEPPPVERAARPASPKGPTSSQAFTAQKAYEDGEETQDEGEDPLEYLQANFEGAPSEDDIKRWRRTHGDVFITGLTDDEVFVWRTVKRLEYKNILTRVASAAQAMARTQSAMTNAEEGRNSLFMEEVCKTCVLWPEINVDQLTFSKAGTMDTLCNLILEASNFVSHGLAVRLTRKL